MESNKAGFSDRDARRETLTFPSPAPESMKPPIRGGTMTNQLEVTCGNVRRILLAG
jgi:hypothetical protein